MTSVKARVRKDLVNEGLRPPFFLKVAGYLPEEEMDAVFDVKEENDSGETEVVSNKTHRTYLMLSIDLEFEAHE